VKCGPLTWPTKLSDRQSLFSLRPEKIRLTVGNQAALGMVRIRGKVQHQAFHGATELIRAECDGGLILVARTAGNNAELGVVELEFDPSDAVLVRESPERA